MLGFQITLIAKSYSHFWDSDALFYMHCQLLETTSCCIEQQNNKQ
jgi:hypothetical protein